MRWLWRRLLAPVRQGGVIPTVLRYGSFFRSRRAFIAMGGQAPITRVFPQLFDATDEHGLDTHYFFQAAWAARLIAAARPELHYDIASDSRFVATVSGFVDTVWIDVRTLSVKLEGLVPIVGDVLDLPLPAHSVHSVSCLSVLEHIGLGRYGDELDPAGMVKAAEQLKRILAPGGNLYLSVPVGRPRVEFNAHRLSDPEDIVSMFRPLQLAAFALARDEELLEAAPPQMAEEIGYANGLFHFVAAES